MPPDWPPLWQPEAREALAPCIDTDIEVDLWVDPPTVPSGTRYGGFVLTTDDGVLRIVHDHSGRPDVYAWDLPRGPVLRLKVRRGPGTRWKVAYTHPDWDPPNGLP